jgi:hypothetical protein
MALVNKIFKDEEPVNFVEQSSGGYKPLEEFFLRKSAEKQVPQSPPKPEVPIKATPKAAKPVSDEEFKNIQASMSSRIIPDVYPAPETAPQRDIATEEQVQQYAPQTTTTEQLSVPVKPIINPDEINSQVETLMKNRGGWSDYLPALVPLLAEAFSGGGANYEGSRIAGEYLLKTGMGNKQREETLQNKLLELQKARLLKKQIGGGLQSKSLVDTKSGRRFPGSYDPRSGQYFNEAGEPLEPGSFFISGGLTQQEFGERQDISRESQIKRARELGSDLRKDPTSGLLSRWENGRLVPVQTPKGLLNPEQSKALDKIVTNFKTTDAFKKPLATLQATANIDQLLQDAASGNPVAAELARSEIAKIAEGGSKLSDQDIQRIAGDPSAKAYARRIIGRINKGQPLLAQDIIDFRQVADTLAKVNRKKLMDSVGGLEDQFVRHSAGIPGAVQTAILPLIPSSAGISKNSMSATAKSVADEYVRVENIQTGKVGRIPKKNLQDALKSKKFKVVP